ncbi:hypothetical protein [Streptomyces sp. SAI-127]|uniref:hypothetical protein n=1 Tax=Streptomyces sp. SAI-127 TaxID=2940543 RepID=UPI002475DD58|nr:hypothetical protein [Streptomyces sp. SAI-127]MDH6489608.1 hypothetical protein [Streptomyces sp. SAI-127]
MRRLGLVAAVAVLVGGSLLTACNDSTTDTASGDGKGGASSSAPAAKKSKAPADVKIVSAKYEDHEVWGDHAFVVRWELTNTGTKAGNFYAGLDFTDADGDVMGSTGITADKLGPGKTAKGDSAPLPAEITKGDIDAIKGVTVSEVERMDY